ncbi:glycoside hydrolase family 108 protein [Oligella urethralis]|uniref:glycoside hydrolase family 108 protein n=1 Tax=Oligella urethralis TaxID=90245 RepID=UPI00288901E8|nr:glycosyl hydrolase 108 family protein [Oligella urethralis]
MSFFNVFFERLISHEGGYVYHTHDPGGETKFGITKRTALAHGYTKPMRDLTREEAKHIYKVAYWQRAKADQYSPAIGFQFFDAAVNHGPGQAIRFLQRAVHVADDGIVGPLTLQAVNKMSVTDVIARFNAERLEFYTKLSQWPHFGKGWTRRVAGNLRYSAEDTND